MQQLFHFFFLLIILAILFFEISMNSIYSLLGSKIPCTCVDIINFPNFLNTSYVSLSHLNWISFFIKSAKGWAIINKLYNSSITNKIIEFTNNHNILHYIFGYASTWNKNFIKLNFNFWFICTIKLYFTKNCTTYNV